MKVALDSVGGHLINHLRVRSLGLGLYTVELCLDDGWAVLCDGSGQVMRFSGLEWARRRLAHLKVSRATLHHASAYHEMIGLGEEAIAPLEVPLDWPSQH